MFTKQEIDGIFSALANDEFNAAINKEARDLLKIAESSDHFKVVVEQFFRASLQSATLGGINMRALAMMVLVSFLLGLKRAPGATAALIEGPSNDIPLTDEEIEKLRKEIDEAHGST